MPSQPAKGSTPDSWPSDVNYIERPIRSKTFTETHMAAIQRTCPNDVNDLIIQPFQPPAFPSPTRIREIADPCHPAYGQRGLFAARHLEPSSFIVIYLGYVHSEAESDHASNYDLSLDREHGISVDATKMGNEARFINDYRGVRKDGPNAEFKDCWIKVELTATGSKKHIYEKCIGIFVLSAGKSGKRKGGIAKGDEILVNYGKGFWRERASNLENEENLIRPEVE